MLYNTVSIHSGTQAQNAAVCNEMEQSLGYQEDPLSILISLEQDPDRHLVDWLTDDIS